MIGKPEDITDKWFGEVAGHPMPGVLVGHDEDGNEILEFTSPTQAEINELLDPFLVACWDLNMNIEHFGLPHGKGWLYERPTVLRIRQICLAEKNRYEAWRMKEGRNLDDRE